MGQYYGSISSTQETRLCAHEYPFNPSPSFGRIQIGNEPVMRSIIFGIDFFWSYRDGLYSLNFLAKFISKPTIIFTALNSRFSVQVLIKSCCHSLKFRFLEADEIGIPNLHVGLKN